MGISFICISKFQIMNKLILCILVCAISFTACTKEIDVFGERKNQMLGEWAMTSIIQQKVIVPGTTTISRDSSVFIATLLDDEKMKLRLAVLNFDEEVAWYYQLRPEKVIVKYNDGEDVNHPLFRPTKYFDVIENTPKSQIWTYKKTNVSPAQTVEIEETWTFKR